MTTTKPFDISTAKVAVLMGGRSAEREISLMSGEGVLKALQSKSVNAHAFDPANQAMDQLTQQVFTHQSRYMECPTTPMHLGQNHLRHSDRAKR